MAYVTGQVGAVLFLSTAIETAMKMPQVISYQAWKARIRRFGGYWNGESVGKLRKA